MNEETDIQRWRRVLDAHRKKPAWLARTIGCERSTITRILKGERKPTTATVAQIEKALSRLANGATREDAFEGCRAALRGLPHEEQMAVLDLLYETLQVLGPKDSVTP